jgi:phospholipid/cholesterol/gamma-HCH transport system substrate-binding protein
MTAERHVPFGTRAGNLAAGYWRYLRNEGRVITNVLVFLVLAAGLIALLIITLFRVQPKYSIFVTFADSGGVFSGQEVTYRGVTVGRVGALKVVRDGVRIQLVVESTYNRIPKDGTIARVMFKSAVGEQFIDLLPVKRTAPYFRGGDDIAIADTELPVQQEELLRLLDRVLSGVPPEAIGNLVDVLGEGLGGRGEQLHAALAALDPLTETLANRTTELNRLAVSGDRLGAAFDATAQDFIIGTKGLGRSVGALGRGSEGLADLLVQGAEYIPDLGELIAARKTQIDALLHNLAEVTRISYENLKSVEDTLDFLPFLLDTVVQAYDAETNRFRFTNLLAEARNPPCSYGTPRRTVAAEGNAPYHPVLDFDCL